MAKRDLKAYVRFDGNGQIIPGSLILSRIKPKVGGWVEGPAYLCCNTTSTTTTVVGRTVVTYSITPEGAIVLTYLDENGDEQTNEFSDPFEICAILGSLSLQGDAEILLIGFGCITTTSTTTTRATTTTTTTTHP